MATEKFDEAQEFTGAIVTCPVCATPQDADAWGHQEFECDNCETKYTVELEQQKVATFALHG